MHANVPLFNEMIEKRNEASREAAIEALDMKEKELSAKRIREFDPELLQVPWVTVHIADQSINLLWHLSSKHLWMELTVLMVAFMCLQND